MTLGKLTGTVTRDENNEFNGMDITGRYQSTDGKFKDVSFHYDFYTNNLRGKVEKVLDAVLNGKEIPEHFTNVQAE